MFISPFFVKRQTFARLFSLASVLLQLSSVPAYAEPGLVSQNPDDYDVPKYEKLYTDAVELSNRSGSILADLNDRVERARDRLERERKELDILVAQIAQNRETIAANTDLIQRLRQENATANQNLDVIQANLTKIGPEIAQKKKEYDTLASQLPDVNAKADTAEANAAKSEQDAVALRQNANIQKGEVDKIQASHSELQKKIDQIQLAILENQKKIDGQKLKLPKLQQQLDAANSVVDQTTKDAATKEQTFKDLDAAATQAEADSAANPGNPQLKQKAVQARKKANEAKTAFNAAVKSRDAAISQQAEARANLDAANASIAQLEQENTESQAALKPLQDSKEEIKAQLATAIKEFQAADTTAKAAEVDARKDRKEATDSRERANTMKKLADDAFKDFNDAKSRQEALEKRRDQLTDLIAQNSQTIKDKQQENVQARSRLDSLEPKYEPQKKQTDQAAHDLADLTQQREYAIAVHQQNKQNEAALAQRLQFVRTALRNGQELATIEGQADGRQDGSNEGARQGVIRGQTDGTDLGGRDGKLQGTKAGQQAARETGAVQGRKDGSALGEIEGTKEGKIEGTAQGTQEGHDAAVASGVDKANKEYRSAALKDVNLGNDGTFSDIFDYPQWQNFNPNRTYPFYMIQNVYDSTYRSTFISNAESQYDVVYARERDKAYSAAYSIAFDDYSHRDYPAERKQGYDNAYASAFSTAKASAKRIAFEDARKTAYSAAYTPAAVDEGYQARSQYYKKNAVLEFEALFSVEDGDKVYAPGEMVSVGLVIKNYGKMSQGNESPVTIQITNPSNGLSVTEATDTVAQVPGQSRAVISGIGGIQVKNSTKLLGGTETFYVTARQGSQVIGTASLSMRISFPMDVLSKGLPDYVLPNQENVVSVSVRNSSAKTSKNAVTVKLTSTDGLAKVLKDTDSAGIIGSGASAEANLSFSFDESNAYRTLNFKIDIYDGSTLVGSNTLAVQSSKRWSYSDSSVGIVVIDSKAEALAWGEAAAHSGLSVDVYDVQVEGPLTSKAMSLYKRKNLILAADAPEAALQSLGSANVLLVGRTQSSILNQLENSFEQSDFQGFKVYQKNFFQADLASNTILETSSGISDDQKGKALRSLLLVSSDVTDKVGTYLSAIPAGDKELEVISKAAVLRDLSKEMKDDEAVDGDNYKSKPEKLRLSKFINLTLSKSGTDRKTLLGFTPAIEEARKEIKGVLGLGRPAQIKKVMKPLLKAYDDEIK